LKLKTPLDIGRIPLSNPSANRWPTGGRKEPGRQTPALWRISKNRRALRLGRI